MIVSIVDFETTGLDTATCEITEAAHILYDWKNDSILRTWSRFIKTEKPIDESVIEITGITPSILDRFGVSAPTALLELRDQFYDEVFPRPDTQLPCTEFFVAHNAHHYDEIIFKRYWDHYFTLGNMQKDFISIPWLCTKEDLPHSKNFKSRSLTHLNMEYGYLMRDAHRALQDCFGCVNLLRQFSIDEALSWKNMPVYEVTAIVKKPWEDFSVPKESDIAKQWGFRFDRESNSWTQKIKEIDYYPLIQQCPLQLEAKQLTFVI